jgi:hypothetical protein
MFVGRQEAFLNRKNQKINEIKQEIEYTEQKECTFVPNPNRQKERTTE